MSNLTKKQDINAKNKKQMPSYGFAVVFSSGLRMLRFATLLVTQYFLSFICDSNSSLLTAHFQTTFPCNRPSTLTSQFCIGLLQL